MNNLNRLYANYPHIDMVNQLIQQVINRENQKFDRDQIKDFVFLSANLENFMPHLSKEEAKNTYMNLHFVKAFMYTEVKEGLENKNFLTHINTNYSQIIKDKKAKIFCAYHLGPYRLIIPFLIKENTDFILLLDDRTIRRQKNEILKQVEIIKDQYKSNSSVEILNAEKENSIYKITSYAKNNYSILAYIDGNTGGKGVHYRNKKLQTTIKFLNRKILARNGLAAISYLSKLPIYPVIAYRPQKQDAPPSLIFEKPISPFEERDLKIYVNNTTKRLYKILENYVKVYYDQWEPWFYIHKYLDQEALNNKELTKNNNINTGKNLLFNSNQFSLFKLEEDGYLFDRRQYLSYQLTPEMYNKLRALERQQTKDQSKKLGFLRILNGMVKFFPWNYNFNTEVIMELTQNNVLIYD